MANILNWKDWTIIAVNEHEHDYEIVAERIPLPPACPRCGVVAAAGGQAPYVGYGGKSQLYLDLPVHAKRAGIRAQRRRFKCKHCGKTFFEPYPEMDEMHHMTRRLVRHIEEQSLNRTFTDVADLVGVDEKTVRLIFRDYVKHLEDHYKFILPAALGIDEIYLLGKSRCVLTNVEQRTVVDLLKDRNQTTVEKWLDKIEDRHKIDVVAIDMWRPYRQAAAAKLPHATVVIDKFHIVRMANDVLETIRRGLRERLTDKQRRTLKKDRYILLRRRHDLDEKDELLLDTWSKNFPTLGIAYQLKESFFDIWDEPDRQAAEAAYRKWVDDLPAELAGEFADLIKAMHNWHEEIFNYFDVGLTNAYTEALNGLIRHTNRLGRGYSFDAIRAKLLYSIGKHKIRRPRYGEWSRRMAEPTPEPYQPDQQPDQPVRDLRFGDVIFTYGIEMATLEGLLNEEPDEPESTRNSE